MEWLWSFSGRCVGYREGDDLFTAEGRHVGHFVGDDVLDAAGQYLGELATGRLIRSRSPTKTAHRGRPRAPRPTRLPRRRPADYAPLALPEGYGDFPKVER